MKLGNCLRGRLLEECPNRSFVKTANCPALAWLELKAGLGEGHLASAFNNNNKNLPPLVATAPQASEGRQKRDGIPTKGRRTHGKEIRALGILLPGASSEAPRASLAPLGDRVRWGRGSGPGPPRMSNAKQQVVSGQPAS